MVNFFQAILHHVPLIRIRTHNTESFDLDVNYVVDSGNFVSIFGNRLKMWKWMQYMFLFLRNFSLNLFLIFSFKLLL